MSNTTDWDVLNSYNSAPIDAKAEALNGIAASNILTGMMIADELRHVAKSLGGISTSIKSLTKVLDKGLSAIVNESRVARLSNEYYLLLDRLVELKEKHPEVKFTVNMEDIANHMVQLSADMIVVLSYCFSFSDKAFERFTIECESGKCNPEAWFDSFLNRAEFAFATRKKLPRGSAARLPDVPRYSPACDMIKVFEDEDLLIETDDTKLKIVGEEVQAVMDFVPGGNFGRNPSGHKYYLKPERIECLKNTIAQVYSTDENSPRIASGYQKLKAWVAEQSCKYLIDYLKELYTDAVVQFLND